MNPYASLSDHEVFNEYWDLANDIDELEGTEFYEWETDEYNLCQREIENLHRDMDELEQEARRRNLSLKWPDNFGESGKELK